jgi:hypothetical protein
MAIATASAKKVAEAANEYEGEYQSTLTKKQKDAAKLVPAKNKAFKVSMYRQGNYPIQSKLRNEEINLNEAIGDHAALAKYADEHGRLDTDDLHRAAEHMKDHNMGALRRHLQNMDTDPRDKVLEYVKKKYYAKLGYTNEAIDLANIIQDKKTGQIATKKGAPPIDLSKITQDKKTGQISAVNEVVTKRKMTSKELVARAAYLAKHKEKMAAADTGIKATKSFSDFNSQRGDFASEPSKMKVSPKSSPKYMDIKEEDKPPFAGPYEKKGEAKDKNVAKNIARKAMKAAVEKAKSKKK